jgi:hypothetical protein
MSCELMERKAEVSSTHLHGLESKKVPGHRRDAFSGISLLVELVKMQEYVLKTNMFTFDLLGACRVQNQLVVIEGSFSGASSINAASGENNNRITSQGP